MSALCHEAFEVLAHQGSGTSSFLSWTRYRGSVLGETEVIIFFEDKCVWNVPDDGPRDTLCFVVQGERNAKLRFALLERGPWAFGQGSVALLLGLFDKKPTIDLLVSAASTRITDRITILSLLQSRIAAILAQVCRCLPPTLNYLEFLFSCSPRLWGGHNRSTKR